MQARNLRILEELDGRNGVWSITAWCGQAGISHVTLGRLDPPPHSVKLGRLRRITESPRQYLERVRSMRQGEQQQQMENAVRA